MLSQFLSLTAILCVFAGFNAHAKLQLEAGSYFNHTHIDARLGRANLNFKYTGCDPNPSSKKIKLTPVSCKEVNSYPLRNAMGRTAVSGKVGEIKATYDDKKNCNKKYTSKIHTNKSLRDLYNSFKKQGCAPTHLVITDGDEQSGQFVDKYLNNKRICELPPTKIVKKDFPTEDVLFNLKATDRGFNMGGHTDYEFDHQRKVWCVTHKDNKSKCGDWPAPLPMAYEQNGKIHVTGTVSLNPDGKASIKSFNKTYDSTDQMRADQKNGELTKNNREKGRIDYHTWRSNSSGVVRAIARAYEKDSNFGAHQRSINFFARNLFGVGITKSWCDKEHCFADIKSDKLKNNLCQPNKLSVDMANGGSGNLCHSCIGITPGHCAVGSSEVTMVKENLVEEGNFKLLHTGEYRLGTNIESGLLKNYSRIVSNPSKPGCFKGYAPSFDELFDPGPALRTNEGRSVNQQNQSL